MLKRLLDNFTPIRTAPMRITLPVLEQIRNSIGSLPAEYGGVLGGRPESGVVTDFHFDRSAQRSKVTYTPDDQLLNRLFTEDWNPKGIRVMGFVHSHPGHPRPSLGDLLYSKQILGHISDLKRLLVPIVISAADSERFEIHPYSVVRNGEEFETVSLPMTVLDEQGERVVDWESTISQLAIAPPGSASASATVVVPNRGDEPSAVAASPATTSSQPVMDPSRSVPEAFRRVVEAYDLPTLERSRVVYIGIGGAAAFAEDLARAGVGQHVLIDHDVVSETNLGTQQAYRRDLGRPKVDVVAERISDINPDAFVLALGRSLDDIDDREFTFLAAGHTDRWPLSQTLICGLTDNFQAQARVNRLALKLGLPSLCAQVYHEGRGAEVTFTHPDVTAACHRCVLSSRYKAYLSDGYKNAVTSDGTPIFATARLNALKGFVAMALLHDCTSHHRWGHLLKKMGNRNLVQVRMDPDLAATLELGVFDQVFKRADGDRLLFDETVWLPQQPEGKDSDNPPCPDCGGTGNLRDSMGTFNNTRVMRRR